MKMAFLTAAAMIATPLVAQTTPSSSAPAGDPATMAAPAAQSAPNAPAPQAMTPDAPMTPPAPAAPAPMTADAGAMPAPATGKLPWCRKGQYTACREHETAKGAGVSNS